MDRPTPSDRRPGRRRAALLLAAAAALAPARAHAAGLQAGDGGANNNFGRSASQSGGTGLVGAPSATVGGNPQQGTAYLFRNLDTAAGTVTQNVKLTATDGAVNNFFGYAVSQSGSTGLVGAYGATVGGNASQGAAYLYRNLDSVTGTVTQNVKLTASDGAAYNYFGTAASQSGNTGLVGAYGATVGGNTSQGAAYLFRNLDTATGTVTQTAKLTASDGAFGNQFGIAVSQSGSTGLVGANGATVGANSFQGAAYLFRNLDTAAGTVTQNVKLTASGGAADNYFGSSVSVDGDQFIVGAFSAKGAVANSGKAYSGSVTSVTTLDAGATTRTISGISFVSQDDWVIGKTTFGNQVALSKGDTATVTASARGVYVGQTAGASNNTLLVRGTVNTSFATVSSGSGTGGNVLEVASDGGATTAGTVNASGGITVNAGGTLRLSGTAASADRLGNATPLTLSGGTFNLGGLSEGAAGATGLGTLTLSATSTLDFGTGGSANVIQFAGVGAHATGAKLQVVDPEGTPGAAGGADRLLFAGLAGAFTLTYAQADVTFEGTAGYDTAQYTGYYEVYAAPEPTSLLLLSATVVPLLGRRRRLGPGRGGRGLAGGNLRDLA